VVGPVRLIDNSPATEALFAAEAPVPAVVPERAAASSPGAPSHSPTSQPVRGRQLERIG